MKKILSLLVALALVLTACGGSDEGTTTSEPAESAATTESTTAAEPEVLTGEAEGHNGVVKVEVTVEGDTITDVQVVEHEETEGISDPAIETIPQQIVENNGTDGVEAVSGASVTSNAIIEAVNNALASR